MTRRTLAIVAAAALVALPGSGRAQETPKPEAPKPETPRADTARPDTAKADSTAERRGPSVTLRVQLLISRYQGDKKLASLPYTLVVTTGGDRARMRMGVDTPVPVTFPSPEEKPRTSFQYKTVGTNIDCAAWPMADGRYKLNISVENSSALSLEKGPSSGAPPVDANPSGIPLFRRFETSINPLLRDGESVQAIASTDPVTGEVVKIDVTMNVVK
jgi:hypothetical protein